jgi:2-polyprenyl-3-methyl-5-hydroxy-6-metoxy-1,4-benzoquinol methylase
MRDTGERILTEKVSPLFIARHLCAYKFAEKYAAQKTVLDLGCGEGYGSAYLAGFAKKVIAVDYSEEAIDYAKKKYVKNNLEFIALDVKDLAGSSLAADVVCSFQVIEHISDPGSYLEGVKKVMAPEGVFICSTCNMLDASPGSSVPLNKFHVKEYLWFEFQELFSGYFKKVQLFALKRSPKYNFYRKLKKSGLFNCLPERFNPVSRFYSRLDCGNFTIEKKGLNNALDFYAVCE